jgi:hypothetical protein
MENPCSISNMALQSLRGSHGPLHYQLKAFIFLYLTKKEGIPADDIETEAKLAEDVVADVYVKSKRLAVEVETFYGTGQAPWRKLQRTIEKYRGRSEVEKVWIVVPPLQTMLYSTLKNLLRRPRSLERRFQLRQSRFSQ